MEIAMRREPLRVLRLLFVIASFTPLVLLWGIRGAKDIPDSTIWWWVAGLTVVPNLAIFVRWHVVRKENLTAQAEVLEATDHREHLVIYLLAVFLAMYGFGIGSVREGLSVVLALALVVLLFWYANLHYLNLAFALLGYRTFTVTRRVSDGTARRSSRLVLLTKRDCVEPGEFIRCYQLSHDLWVEKEA